MNDLQSIPSDQIPDVWPWFQSVYRDSFPEVERLDEGFLLDSILAGNRRLWILSTKTPNTLAVTADVGGGVRLLEYFATAQEARGQGHGKEALHRLIAAAEEDGMEWIVLEVDDDLAPSIDRAESDLRSRRIAFYERQGGIECGPPFSYLVPSLVDDGAISMKLYRFSTGVPAPAKFDLEKIRTAVYRCSYPGK